MKYTATKKDGATTVDVESNEKQAVSDTLQQWHFDHEIHYISNRTVFSDELTRWEKGNVLIECNYKAK